jgi:hypothetical protein
MALSLALVAVYDGTLFATLARIALGLLVVFAALFIGALVNSPLFFGALGFGPGNPGPFYLASGRFEAIALSVFLGLSLE